MITYPYHVYSCTPVKHNGAGGWVIEHKIEAGNKKNKVRTIIMEPNMSKYVVICIGVFYETDAKI